MKQYNPQYTLVDQDARVRALQDDPQNCLGNPNAMVARPAPKHTMPINIYGLALKARLPYAEGHVCTADEANVLNRARIHGLRTNFSRSLRGLNLKDPKVAADVRERFHEYDAGYSLSARYPVESEAKKIARAIIREALARKNLRPEHIPPERHSAMVDKVAQRPEVIAEAQHRVDTRRQSFDITSTGASAGASANDSTSDSE